jgi:hypothetical protein
MTAISGKIPTLLESFETTLIGSANKLPLQILANIISEPFASNKFVEAVVQLKQISDNENIRVLIHSGDGIVSVDTFKTIQFLSDINNVGKVHENAYTRTSIRRAAESDDTMWFFETRRSNTTGKNTLYIARRFGNSPSNTQGGIRVSIDLPDIF